MGDGDKVSWGREILTKSFQHFTPRFEEFSNAVQSPASVSIHNLNEDCFDLILAHLSLVELLNAAKVCRKWYNACLDAAFRIDTLCVHCLMKELKGRFDVTKTTLSAENVRTAIMMTQGNLKKLLFCELHDEEIYCEDKVSDSTTCRLHEFYGYFDEDSNSFDKDMVRAISLYCPNLEMLDISSKVWSVPEENSPTAEYIASHLPRSLKYLILQGNSTYDEEWLTIVTENLTNLEGIDLKDNGWFTGNFIQKNLSQNKLKYIKFASHCNELALGHLQYAIKTNAETLEYLNIGYSLITPEFTFVRTGIPALPAMKELHVRGSRYRDFMGEHNLDSRFQELDIWSFTESKMPRLNALAPLLQMPNLEVLELKYCCNFVKDPQYLDCITASCPQLRELSLDGFVITSLIQLQGMEKLKSLRKLHIAIPINLSGETLNYTRFFRLILTKLKSLDLLSLKFCPSLTDEDLYEVMQSCPNLSTIHVASDRDSPLVGKEFLAKCGQMKRETKLKIEVFEKFGIKKIDVIDVMPFLQIRLWPVYRPFPLGFL